MISALRPGFSHAEFYKSTFGEFESICKAWSDMTGNRSRESWQRTRTLAAICIQPQVKKKITPRQLLPMPWDKKEPHHRGEAENITAEQRQMRFENLEKHLGRQS